MKVQERKAAKPQERRRPNGKAAVSEELLPAHLATWSMLREPTEVELSAALYRIVCQVVVGDSRAVRREDQLRELLHVLLVKVDSDRRARAGEPVVFRPHGPVDAQVSETARAIRLQFRNYFTGQGSRVFLPDDRDELRLLDETIHAVVEALWPWRILGGRVDLLAKAFQIFRTDAMKSGEGQFLTPQRIIRPCVLAMDITADDRVIDPACGSGGFVIEALRQVQERSGASGDLLRFANQNLYAVDKDPLGVKLTKAILLALGSDAGHTLCGDAVRLHRWPEQFPELARNLAEPAVGPGLAERFTVVLTNPPFGEGLKVAAADARQSGYSITRHAAAAAGGRREHADLEIGLVYLELAHRLLCVGGRVGIILAETYFFSHKFRWLTGWLAGRLELRGMLNIAMEAFEEFCRAKTNFYVFEKVGHGPLDGEAR